jgi:hypothetical protein
MTTPAGQISLNDVNVELGFAGTTLIQMNQANVRTLAGVGGSGTVISMQNLQGKSNRVTLSYVYSANTANASLNLSGISGYISGKSDITVTINSGIYLYATSTGGYGLALSGATTGDTVLVVNNGYIMGQGGAGGTVGGNAGGPALNLGIGINPTITNTSGYILGGGGGGGGGNYFSLTASGGGGGAGSGAGGTTAGGGTGGAGGGLGASGSNGVTGSGSLYAGGGGGGRVVLGTGGNARTGGGGAAGGLGGGSGGSGGIALDAGKNYQYWGIGGGGGGWGASGGNGMFGSNQTTATSGAGGSAGASGGSASGVVSVNGTPAGGGGGKGVNLSGRTVTWTGGSASTNRVYGAIS